MLPPLILSLLYLLLNLAVLALVGALILWALRFFSVPLDPLVLKIAQGIFALIAIILIVSWLLGALPPRGIFGGSSVAPGEFASRLHLLRFV
jgi:hypothetical protein